MAVLDVVRDACAEKLGIPRLETLYSNTSPVAVQLAALTNAAAEAIAADYAWQKLRLVRTITGDGTTEDFDLPSDFDRMLADSSLWSNRLGTKFRHIADHDIWLGLEVREFDLAFNSWTIYGDQVHIKPAPAAGETVKFWYVSNLLVRPATGANKTRFTLDTDEFRLDERLLKLCLIWKWREAKGLPYAEALDDYEDAKEKRIGADRGPRIIRDRAPISGDATIAYPWNIEP